LNILDTTARRAPFVAVVLMAGCLIAACGSSSSSTTTSSSSSPSSAAAGTGGSSASARRASLRTCLKAHGVTLPARPAGAGAPPAGAAPPGGGGPGFFGGGGGGGGGFANNPKLRAAVQACGGFRGTGARRFQLSHSAINSYVSCVRQHGFNMPSPNFSGKGAVFPASIRTNPKFQAASKPCAGLLARRRGAGTGTTTGPTA
jgi:hypothetical protein